MQSKIFGTACVFIFCFSGAAAFADDVSSSPAPIAAFSTVVKGHIYRGAAPNQNGVAWLAQNKVKTIIDLRMENPAGEAEEAAAAKSAGLTYVNVPMNPFGYPKDADIELLENNLLVNKKLQPLFIHCEYGVDRTGLVVALYRIFDQKVAPATAYQEMLDAGFHKYMVNFVAYFYERTGYAALVLPEVVPTDNL